MKMAYYLFLERMITTLMKRNVDPQKVINVLPRKEESEINVLQGKDMQQLFEVGSPVYDKLSWKKAAVLAQLMTLCEDEACRMAFQNYCAKLASYNIKHGSAVYVGDNYISILNEYED